MPPWSARTSIAGAALVSLLTALAYAGVARRPTLAATVLVAAAVLALLLAALVRSPVLRAGLLAAVVANQVLLMLPSPLFLPAASASVAATLHAYRQHQPRIDRRTWAAAAAGAGVGVAAMVAAVVAATSGPS